MTVRKQLTLGLVMLMVLAVFTYMFPAKGEARGDCAASHWAGLI